jgi:hypothetical protein
MPSQEFAWGWSTDLQYPSADNIWAVGGLGNCLSFLNTWAELNWESPTVAQQAQGGCEDNTGHPTAISDSSHAHRVAARTTLQTFPVTALLPLRPS